MMEALFRSEAWDFMLQPVSPANEKAVCESMIAGCRCAPRTLCLPCIPPSHP